MPLATILETYPKVNGHEVGYAMTVVPYHVAKDIAAILGFKTRKMRNSKEYKPAPKLMDLRGHDLRLEFSEHNPRFSALDMTRYAIYYLRGRDAKSLPIKEPTLEQIYPSKAGTTLKKRAVQSQRDDHLVYMSKQIGITPDEFLATMKKWYVPIHSEKDFSLIDPSDLLKYILAGEKDKDRYPNTYEALKERYGNDTELMVYCLAATSIKSTLDSNIAKAIEAFKTLKNNVEITWTWQSTVKQLEKIQLAKNTEDESFEENPLTWRKVMNFANSMLGDKDAIVFDVWQQRSLRVDRDRSPTNKEYDQAENLLRMIAYCIDREPRQVGAAVWCGLRGRIYNEQVYYEVAIDKFLRRKEKAHLDKAYHASLPTLFDAMSALEAEKS